MSLRRTILPLLLAAVLAALAPAAASADDASMAKVALAQAQLLGAKETASSRAVTRVDVAKPKTIATALTSIAGVRRQIDTMVRKVRAQDTSTPEGADVRKRLIALVTREKRGLGELSSGLKALRGGDAERGQQLVERATKRLEPLQKQGRALGEELGALAAGEPGAGTPTTV